LNENVVLQCGTSRVKCHYHHRKQEMSITAEPPYLI
jgi:hypothetical protein